MKREKVGRNAVGVRVTAASDRSASRGKAFQPFNDEQRAQIEAIREQFSKKRQKWRRAFEQFLDENPQIAANTALVASQRKSRALAALFAYEPFSLLLVNFHAPLFDDRLRLRAFVEQYGLNAALFAERLADEPTAERGAQPPNADEREDRRRTPATSRSRSKARRKASRSQSRSRKAAEQCVEEADGSVPADSTDGRTRAKRAARSRGKASSEVAAIGDAPPLVFPPTQPSPVESLRANVVERESEGTQPRLSGERQSAREKQKVDSAEGAWQSRTPKLSATVGERSATKSDAANQNRRFDRPTDDALASRSSAALRSKPATHISAMGNPSNETVSSRLASNLPVRGTQPPEPSDDSGNKQQRGPTQKYSQRNTSFKDLSSVSHVAQLEDSSLTPTRPSGHDLGFNSQSHTALVAQSARVAPKAPPPALDARGKQTKRLNGADQWPNDCLGGESEALKNAMNIFSQPSIASNALLDRHLRDFQQNAAVPPLTVLSSSSSAINDETRKGIARPVDDLEDVEAVPRPNTKRNLPERSLSPSEGDAALSEYF